MKLPISHKRINQIVFVIIAIAGSIYYFNSNVNTQEKCEDMGDIWHEGEQTCEQKLSQFIFNQLSSDHPVTMRYPDSKRKIVLEKYQEIEKVHYLVGHYEEVLEIKTEEKEGVYDRGSIYLNMSKMTMLTEERNKKVYFVTPFVTQTAGSGVFVYVGLFSFDSKTNQTTHLDSALLGDRIRNEKIHFINDFIQVDYSDYATGQAMSEQPSEASVISLRLIDMNISGKKAHFEKVQRLHHSWNRDQDGLNDCEKEGRCDHTVDYTKPKI